MWLLVGIDTEGDNQWDAAARADQRFENIYALPRLHALFARHRIRPTYLITYPVAADARSAEVLRDLRARGDCEIGAHHHAWETPPCAADDVRRHPYAASLPLPQFEAQLSHLTGAIERAVGTRPVSYRSGRFGFAAAHVPALERLGYLVESSVAPLCSPAADRTFALATPWSASAQVCPAWVTLAPLEAGGSVRSSRKTSSAPGLTYSQRSLGPPPRRCSRQVRPPEK